MKKKKNFCFQIEDKYYKIESSNVEEAAIVAMKLFHEEEKNSISKKTKRIKEPTFENNEKIKKEKKSEEKLNNR